MFILKTSESEGGTEGPAALIYSTLDAAIDAAVKDGLDLNRATIEKQNVTTVSVNEWMAARIAGGVRLAPRFGAASSAGLRRNTIYWK
jgi:hypothetical protein